MERMVYILTKRLDVFDDQLEPYGSRFCSTRPDSLREPVNTPPQAQGERKRTDRDRDSKTPLASVPFLSPTSPDNDDGQLSTLYLGLAAFRRLAYSYDGDRYPLGRLYHFPEFPPLSPQPHTTARQRKP
ncbi:hypothetical protein ACJJTC_015762 [Scirpophaga incertulas]